MTAIAAFFLFALATGVITGTVTDSVTHQPVHHALISAPDGTRDATDADGRKSSTAEGFAVHGARAVRRATTGVVRRGIAVVSGFCPAS
jgi:hypothetical protein